jgi:2-polyprenyl-3-methyl-5-hydroxy-6-metoxy-1,4-benzoquinol methylase
MISRAYENRRLRLMAELTRGPEVLDIGCAQLPNEHLARYDPVGLDLSEPSGPDAASVYREWVCGDAARIDELLDGRKFDTIVCAELIEHLERPYDFLRRVRTLLRSDSRLVLSTPNPLAPPVVFAELFRSRRFYYVGEHVYYFLPRWMVRMLERTGYVVEEIRPVGFGHPFFVLPAPSVLSYQLIYVARPADETDRARE